jgi:hypothetical protein
MNPRIPTLPLLLALVLVPAAAPAETALGLKAGTLGGGVELTTGLGNQVEVRIGANAFNYSERREASDIEYDAEARARTATGLLDWHPGARAFRLTGGVIYNNSTIEGRSLPPASGAYNIGGIPVPVNLVGTLDGTIDFDPVSPYAGIGWGNSLRTTRRLGVSFDLGVVFLGGGDVTLTPRIPAGSPLNDPIARAILQVQLDREAEDIENDLQDYDYYPVLSLGLTYRF